MKRIIYTLACLMLSVGAWAQTSLQEQINAAADGATIALSADENLTSTVTIAKNITLNLNGHNIAGTGARALQITNGNVTITGTGTITSTGIADNSSVIRVGDNTTSYAPSLTIDENVKVTSACSYGVTIFGTNTSETLVVNGTVETTTVMASAISGNGSAGFCETTITIGENANISAENDVAIYHPQAGNLTVNGTVSGLGGIEIKAGSLTVGENAKISATGTASHNANVDGTSTRGYAIAIVENNKYKGVSNVNVNSSATITGSISTILDSEKAGFNPTFTGIEMVAEVDGVKYSTLADAFAAATAEQTVKLLSDVKLSAKLEVTCSDVTLDLNGKTISPADNNTVGNNCMVMVHRGAKLTVDDSSPEKTGCIDGGTGTNAFYGGIQLTQKEDTPADAKATLVVNNGTIKGNKAAITGNGNRHNTEITINGGTFIASSDESGEEGCAIYHPQEGMLTINGGIFTGYGSAVEMRSGTLNITGGEFTATATSFSEKPNGNGTTIIGSALAISQHTTNKAINVNISGGTFNGPKAVYEKDNQDNNSDNINIAISGGIFNADVSSENVEHFISGGTFSSVVPEEYCATGFIPTNDGNGQYGVIEGSYVAQIGDTNYASLADAIAAVPTDGTETTITMLTDVDLSATVTVEYGKNVVLDLNGYNITSTVLAIKNLGNLELKGTGNITVNGTKNTLYGISNAGAAGKKANLIIGENVTVTAPCVAVYTSYGKTTVNGTLANTQADASNIYSTLRLSQTSSEVIVAASAKVTGVVNAIYGDKGILEVNSTNVGKIYADGSALQGLKIKKTVAIEGLNVYGHAEFSDVADYYVAAKAISACTGTVKLLSDINAALAVSANKTVTLDLNGHKVTAETTPIKVEGNLTITGEGTAQSTGMGSSTAVQAAAYVLKNGKLTILSGNYVAGFEGAEGNPAVYVRDNAVVEIKGGDFVGGSKFLLNKLDAYRETSVIEVTGGTFQNNFNPADNPAEGEHTNFVADDYKAVDNGDGTFTVVPCEYVAQVGENKYESLSEAVAAAQAGQTVTLLVDINEAVENTNANDFTINLNGKTWTSDATSTFKNNGGTVTITDETGNGTIKNTANAKDMGIAVWARTGSIVIEKGTFVSQSNYEATVYVGTSDVNLDGKTPTITIDGGSFKNTAEGVYAHNTAILPLTLNIINNIATADSYQAIVVKGGEFYGNDPSIGDDSQLNKINNNSNFVSAELHAEMKDGVFVIEEGGYVAQVGYLKYLTLADAAKSGESITLLANATIETIDVVNGKTIDKNGHEITVNNFNVIDYEACNVPFDFKANTATYTREIGTNVWGTVCVPFTLKSCDAYKLYKVSNISGDKLNVTEVEEATPGTPVIFKAESSASSITFSTAEADVKNVTLATDGALVGTYSETKITSGLPGNIYFINGNQFHQAQVSLTVPMYRAYINYATSGAKPRVLSIVVDEEATAIESFDANAEIIAIYDASGRQLTAPKKGLNIMKLSNGKTAKLFVK